MMLYHTLIPELQRLYNDPRERLELPEAVWDCLRVFKPEEQASLTVIQARGERPQLVLRYTPEQQAKFGFYWWTPAEPDRSMALAAIESAMLVRLLGHSTRATYGRSTRPGSTSHSAKIWMNGQFYEGEIHVDWSQADPSLRESLDRQMRDELRRQAAQQEAWEQYIRNGPRGPKTGG